MSAPQGNNFWQMRATSGPKLKYDNPEQLWEDCSEYFALRSEMVMNNQPLPFTLASLCLFLNISQDTWCEWRKSRDDLSEVITRVDDIVRDQKMTGAIVGSYNHNIIARDLGLVDKKESELKGNLTVERVKFGDGTDT